MALLDNKSFECSSYFDDEPIPIKHIFSEGESLIKTLAQKQLNTFIDKQENKEFIHSSEILPVSKFLAGQLTVKDFEESHKILSRIEYLKRHNLTLDEIKYIVDYENNPKQFFITNKKIETTVLNNRLKRIYEKIEQNQKTNVSTDKGNPNSISRHIKEIGLAVKPGSKETQLFKFAIDCIKHHNPSLVLGEDSINDLERLERDLLSKCDTQKLPKRLRHKIRRLEKIKPLEFRKKRKLEDTLWDIRTPCNLFPKEEEAFKVKSTKVYTIKNKRILLLNQNAPDTLSDNGPLCKKEKKEQLIDSFERLSIEEIRKISRFNGYTPGIPNNVLYLKNLAKQISEEDLYRIYSSFYSSESNEVKCKLMNGKMKCQAFITFPDVDKASDALNATLGIVLKGKPLIIYFSNSSR